MGYKEKSIALELLTRLPLDLFIIISLIFLLIIPSALAREPQATARSSAPSQPGVPVTSNQETGKAISQTQGSSATNNSIDFLMGNSPLAGGAATNAAPSSTLPEPTAVNNVSQTPVTLQVLQGTILEKTDEVAMLVSEQCSQNGDAADGSSSCSRVYSNGHHATVLTQNANEGDELKHQTVVEEFDADNTLLYKKTIRHRVDYNYLNDHKAKEKEFFDIIYQPAGRKATRELMVYEYFLDTGKAKSLSWTQYKQIGNEPKAGLVYHALLRYGDDGSPDRGLAERWDQGVKTETFMNWSRRSKGFATLDQETWNEWEGWIRNVSLQAYLP